jgi:hypothetical protein
MRLFNLKITKIMYRSIAAIFLTCALALVGDFHSNVVGEFKVDRPQPEPLILKDSTIIQPIIENIDMERKYWYLRTVKVYYVDYMPKQIDFRKGAPLTGYCSDSTKLTIVTQKLDTISRYSVKRLSCRILAIVNLEPSDITKLKSSPVQSITIYNRVTDNSYKYDINTSYFQEVIP